MAYMGAAWTLAGFVFYYFFTSPSSEDRGNAVMGFEGANYFAAKKVNPAHYVVGQSTVKIFYI